MTYVHCITHQDSHDYERPQEDKTSLDTADGSSATLDFNAWRALQCDECEYQREADSEIRDSSAIDPQYQITFSNLMT